MIRPTGFKTTRCSKNTSSLRPPAQVKEAKTGDEAVALSLKDAGLPTPELLLLEEGRVPREGEVRLQLCLWHPTPDGPVEIEEEKGDGEEKSEASKGAPEKKDPADAGSETTPGAMAADEAAEAAAAAVYVRSVMARQGAVQPLSALDMHVQQTALDLYHHVRGHPFAGPAAALVSLSAARCPRWPHSQPWRCHGSAPFSFLSPDCSGPASRRPTTPLPTWCVRRRGAARAKRSMGSRPRRLCRGPQRSPQPPTRPLPWRPSRPSAASPRAFWKALLRRGSCSVCGSCGRTCFRASGWRRPAQSSRSRATTC